MHEEYLNQLDVKGNKKHTKAQDLGVLWDRVYAHANSSFPCKIYIKTFHIYNRCQFQFVHLNRKDNFI